MGEDCCRDLKDLLRKYDDKDPKFHHGDFMVLARNITEPAKQCKCLTLDQSLIKRLQNLLKEFIHFCIECIQMVSKRELEDKDQRKEKVQNLEKIFQGLSKLFQVHYPLYQIHRRVHGKVQELSIEQKSKFSEYCDLVDDDIPVYLLENVCFFGANGGLDSISSCFEHAGDSMPLSLASCLISIVAQVRVWLHNQAIIKFIHPLTSHVIRYLCDLPEEEFRLPSERGRADLMLNAVKVQLDNNLKLDRDSLELAFKYFVSSTLTIRMAGLNQISNQIHNLIELSQNDAFGEVDSLCQEHARWLIEKKIPEHLFGPNHHVELIKQSQFLLNFLAQERVLKPDHLNCIWQAAQLKHAGRYVLDLLISLTKHLDLESVKYVLSLIAKLPLSSHTKQTLFLASLLTRHIWSTSLTGPKKQIIRKKKAGRPRIGVQQNVLKKKAAPSPASRCVSSGSSEGSTDEEMASIHASRLSETAAQVEQLRSLDLDLNDSQLRVLTNSAIVGLSQTAVSDPMPEEQMADDSDDNVSCSNTNVSSVSDRERDIEDFEVEDEVIVSHPLEAPEEEAVEEKEKEPLTDETEDLCAEGKTLLWDLVQEETLEEVGDNMRNELLRLLWQLICYAGNKQVRMNFIKGCLKNISQDKAAVVSFQILPKILSVFPHSSNGSEAQCLLGWAVKELNMMQIFFANLTIYVENWRTQGQCETDIATSEKREQEIQARLDFLTALFSNEISPDHFRLTINQVDLLWDCLVTKVPEDYQYLVLSWLLKQANNNNKELHALGLDAFKHVFMNKLPEINPEKITLTGLSLFQQLFSLTRLSNASPFTEGSLSKEILGVDFLWEIVLKAERLRVAEEAMGYLNYLYITIGEGGMEKEKEFLQKCMKCLDECMLSINEHTLRKIQQLLTILKTHLDEYRRRFAFHIHLWHLNGQSYESHQPGIHLRGKDNPIRIICQPAGVSEKVTFTMSSYDLLAKLRAEVTHWCTQIQNARDKKGDNQSVPILRAPFRLISHGHELIPDFDLKTLGDLGVKDQQLVFVSVSLLRKERAGNSGDIPASMLPSPEPEASPMAQLVEEKSLSRLFTLLELLEKASASMPVDKFTSKKECTSTESDLDDSVRENLELVKTLPPQELLYSAWELIQVLPTNFDIKRLIKTCKQPVEWASLLDCSQKFRLLYVLQVIDCLSSKVQDVLYNGLQEDTSSDSESSLSENDDNSLKEPELVLQWAKKFIDSGGMRHLYFLLESCLTSVPDRCDDWILDIIAHIIKLITRFGCVTTPHDEKSKDEDCETGNKRSAKGDKKAKKHVFRARYKSVEGDNIVVIQGFNKPLLTLIHGSSLLEKVISLLCAVSETKNLVSAGNQDVRAAVVYHALSFLVCWTYSNSTVKAELIQHQDFALLLKRLIFLSPQRSVRSEASRGIYKMCVSGEAIVSEKVLRLLLDMLPEVVGVQAESSEGKCLEAIVPSSSNYKEFFWVLCRLIDKYRPASGSHFDFEQICESVANFIMTQRDLPSTQGPSPSSVDYCLVGLLQVCAALLRHNQSFKMSSRGGELLQDIFKRCLFTLPQSPTEIDVIKPRCTTKSSSVAAYELLLELVSGCEKNFKLLFSLLFRHHSPDPQSGSHFSYGWNYWPHEFERSPVGYVGLVNLGATCYMASCIQQMFMIPKARATILSAKTSEQTKFPAILKELQKMFTYLQESLRKAYNPRSFCKTYTMDKQPLNTGEQKDMAEFFTDLIAKLEDMDPELKSMVRDLFCGVITNNVISLDCEHVSKTEEEFYSVRCTVADMKNLYESLDEVTIKDILEGDNKYTCSQCLNKVRAEKRACFKMLPKVLCFNTMRYTFNMVTMMKEKVNTHFSFPMKLNMAQYTEDYLMAPHNDQDPDEDPTYWYNLAGVVVHTGTAEGGHYYSFIRDRYSVDNWYLFNDAEVKPFDPSQIAAECFGGEMTTKTFDAVTEKYTDFSFEKTHSAYMLFYEHSRMEFEEQPPKKVDISKELQQWIWEENFQFVLDKLIYDLTYFNFMWQLCNTVPKTIENNPQVLFLSIKLATSFLLETFVHSREKPHMKGWVDLLMRGLARCQPGCEWYLDSMATDDYWLQQIFIRCPTQPIRLMFAQLCLQAIKILRPFHLESYSLISDEYVLTSVRDSDSNEGDSSDTHSSSPITRFMKCILGLLEENVKSYCKNLSELFGFIYQFISLGSEECNFLLNIDAISTMVHFYMDLKASEMTDSSMDDYDDLDLDDDDILSIFHEEKFNPSALEKMVSSIASLVEESREGRQLQLSENDYKSLTGGKGLPFIYQITKDSVNLRQTANIVCSLSRFNQSMAEPVLDTIFAAVQKLPPEQSQPFFRLLSILTDLGSGGQPGFPSFTNLILPKIWQACEFNPGLCIDWLTTQVTRNKVAHQWVLQQLDQWVEKYLVADNSLRIRNAAAYLLVSLVPNHHFAQAFRVRSFSAPQREWKVTTSSLKEQVQASVDGKSDTEVMAPEAKTVLHKIYLYLLDLLSSLKKYCDTTPAGTTRLVNYFAVLNHCLISHEEKKMFTAYSSDLWHLFHPVMSEPDIAVHCNKQALLTFWFHVCVDCVENVKFITDTAEVSSNIAYNYILSNDDQEVISYNRLTLPAYYGLLRIASQHSKKFCRHLASHPNLSWAFEHLTPRINQYPQAVEELFNLLQLFAGGGKYGTSESLLMHAEFRKKTIALYCTSIDGQSAWTTLISAFKILLQSEEDCVTVALNKGLQTLTEAFSNLHLMYHEATACNVVGDITEILRILMTVLNCCQVFIDKQEVHKSLSMWTERTDMIHKLLSLLNSYAPPEIRKSCIELLNCMLVISPEDSVEAALPVLQQSHLATRNLQTPQTPGPHFPRRSAKVNPRKLALRANAPELNMALHPSFVEIPRGVDEAYDLALHDYFHPYHHYVDKLCRYGLNLDQVPQSIMDISCLLAVEAVPLHFSFFPKLWLEVYNKAQDNPKYKWCLKRLIQCEPFIEYIDTVLADEREAIDNSQVYSFLCSFLPKVHMEILGGQKQTLVNTIVSTVVADCTWIREVSNEELDKVARRMHGDLRALCLLLSVSSPEHLSVSPLLSNSLQQLIKRCDAFRQSEAAEVPPSSDGSIDSTSPGAPKQGDTNSPEKHPESDDVIMEEAPSEGATTAAGENTGTAGEENADSDKSSPLEADRSSEIPADMKPPPAKRKKESDERSPVKPSEPAKHERPSSASRELSENIEEATCVVPCSSNPKGKMEPAATDKSAIISKVEKEEVVEEDRQGVEEKESATDRDKSSSESESDSSSESGDNEGGDTRVEQKPNTLKTSVPRTLTVVDFLRKSAETLLLSLKRFIVSEEAQ